jgi:hypothetical protein
LVRPGALGSASGKAALRAGLELVSRHDALLDQQGREARQRAFVIAGAEVMARLHPLDRMAVFVHVEDAEAHRERIERIRAHFPRRMERGASIV